MSVNASCGSVSQERTLSSLIASRQAKRPKLDDVWRLQKASIQLLEQQNLCGVLREVEVEEPRNCGLSSILSSNGGSLLGCELIHQATLLSIPIVMLSVKMVLERLMEITGTEGEEEADEDKRRELLTCSQRAQLCVLLESSKDLLSQGILCPKLLWQEYTRDQRPPNLEMVYHLHVYNILTLKYILESDEGFGSWLVGQLRALCTWTPPQGEEETKQVQQKLLLMVVGVLVGSGFELIPEPAAQDKKISLLCSSALDEMLFWLLDTVDEGMMLQSARVGAEFWIQIYDASLCGASVSPEALRRFFMHSLTQTLTYKPRLTVSDAITLQSKWTFAKASRLLTSLFRKLAVVFNVEQLLHHLQQILETHEVNWKHVLSFLSTLLVYTSCAHSNLRKLLSGLLSSAFENYDLEKMITAFLLARQTALEDTSISFSYSEWFKISFGSGNGCHATSKKSLVFLLKFLSDLVPFEPPQYLKVHVLHPPYIPVRHRTLLMEYSSLAKTRLADLKESVEDMGLYEDIAAARGVPVQCQAARDVDKAVSLFESTGRISTTVIEASIFRRPYFLTRFLPALLIPRVLPLKADAQMRFIEALKNADKIPAAQYSSYLESCQTQRKRQHDRSVMHFDASDDPLEVLNVQLQEFTQLVADGENGEMAAQLSRISHTLSILFPGCPDEIAEQAVIKLHIDPPVAHELYAKVINIILRNFCQCVLDASQANPPNKQSPWASRFISVLLGNKHLLASLIQRLWDLFHKQLSSLSTAQILGLAVFLVHLHTSMSHTSLIQLVPPILTGPVPVEEALSAALDCTTKTHMLSCVRLCVAAVCYGFCRGDLLPKHQQQDYILSNLYKKLLYLIPRLLPEARMTPITAEVREAEDQEENLSDLWISAKGANSSWKKTAWYLWRRNAFQQLQHIPKYQLSFSEWLVNELRVQRVEDDLSDSERQEYQRWACMEHYRYWPEELGGCGGDMRSTFSHLLSGIMDQQFSDKSLRKLDRIEPVSGTCLPDILSRLQELVYEMEVTNLYGGWRERADVFDFLFKFVSQRCSSTVSSISLNLGTQLSLQQIIGTWNRVLVTLPAVLFLKVKVKEGKMTLDCDKLIEHVNQHQRKVCSPAGLLPRHVTAHFLRGLLFASVYCECPRIEINKAWSQISLLCPLLLKSTVHWWGCLSPGLTSLWHSLCNGEPLPEELQILTDCQHWAQSLGNGMSSRLFPQASALLLGSSLHCAWQVHAGDKQGFSEALNMLQPETDLQHQQEKIYPNIKDLCTDLLSLLVDSADWLLIFKPSEHGVYQSVTKVTSDEFTRLMPWAFYSLLLQQSAELLSRAARCPGFLPTAITAYIHLLQLFLEGDTTPAIEFPDEHQQQPSQILRCAKQFLLRWISQISPAALSSCHLRQLESQCADLDPEVAAALSVHLHLQNPSPVMDFL
ncbi:Fanconi anemia group A protein isoform X2 [Echeneis naucrates]|uniref:Fanconi anemia group A protein isoform X2 n=1 Tax=Echeneis naucrates TaxID=173247 RepID=UPI001113D70C|nr:Fanconi anemia group A protein isoform X2 [Echeneis naucrates]